MILEDFSEKINGIKYVIFLEHFFSMPGDIGAADIKAGGNLALGQLRFI